MPATKKQVKSNRKNATKSTGPKTKEGKAITAQNAVRHGLYSKDLVLNSCNLKEDEDEFEKLKNDLYDDYQPVGPLEESLVDKITNAIWRSRRVARAEVAIVNRQLRRLTNIRFTEPDWSDEEDQQDFLDKAHSNSIPDSRMTANILRYEMRLDRQISRSYALLLHVQQRRCDTMMQDLKAGKLKDIQRRSASQEMVRSAGPELVLNASEGFARDPHEKPNYDKPPDPPDENYKYSEPPNPPIEKPKNDETRSACRRQVRSPAQAGHPIPRNEKPNYEGTNPIPPNTRENNRLQRLLKKAD